MKQKDIALILIVMFVSAVLSFVLSNLLFSGAKARNQKIEVVAPITADFPIPDNKYFNSNSIDPTQVIHIGGNNNTAPFNSKASQ